MQIGKDCFDDVEVEAFIESNSTTNGKCEVCHTYGKVIDSLELRDFFVSLLQLFEASASGFLISEIILNDWGIFKNKIVADTILREVLTEGQFNYDENTKVNYTKDILERIGVWDRLKNSVKHNFRFFTSIDEIAKYKYITSGSQLLKGRKLYRSRITPYGQKKLKAKKMGCPPKELATAGRANPAGIPYLYLSDSAKTTYFEVRALYLDKLSVGTFEIVKDLKLVDFVYDVNLYAMCQDGDIPLKEVVVKKKVIDAISYDLSKPLRRYDSDLEYVPTQLICEYCRNFADGICFESSLYKGEHNYVLFDSSNANCISVESHEIRKIDIDRQ